MSNVEWHHYSGIILDPSGIQWVTAGPDAGKHAISAGGYVGPIGYQSDQTDGTNEDTLGLHIRTEHRIVGTRVDVDTDGTRRINVAIAGPLGSRFRSHLYVITED